MEAKLKKAEFDCYNKSFFLYQRKEESRDCVVPDTQPDIAEVLFCGARVLIRSKDVSAGRVRTEAAVNGSVLYKGEDGKIWALELSLPFFFSGEDERIVEEAAAMAELCLVNSEARALNPRKILFRAELEAEISIYQREKLSLCESVEDTELIRCRSGMKEASLVSAVTEKTFALSDEISLPPAAAGSKEIICLGIDSSVEETKAVGSKLIIKGKVKSRFIIIKGEGEIYHLEPVSDFSQILELGSERGSGSSFVCLTPSGSYCGISPDNEGRISLEYHMVAQLIYRSNLSIEFVDEVYSNCYELHPERAEKSIERIQELGRMRESLRQLYETSRPVSEVLFSHVQAEKTIFEKGKMRLPYTFFALCSGGDDIWCEKRRGELVFRISAEEGDFSAKGAEILDWALLPVPGGMELRLEASAELICRKEEKLSFVSAIRYDEEKLIDNSEKPSLVLLRLQKEDELWDAARENCSSVEAILSANGFEDGAEAAGKLILIPKTN